MASKQVELQRWARTFREREKRDLSAHEIAEFLKAEGWPMPQPKDPIDILAKDIASAQREEMIFDEVLGESYNANICYPVDKGEKQLVLWGELDRADRKKVVKNVALRRDQVVGDLVQVEINVRHWNRINPNETEVQVELDFGPDVEWKLNTPKGKSKGAGN